MQLSTKHLLGIKDLQPEDINLILSTKPFKRSLQRPVKKVPSLRDVTIVKPVLQKQHHKISLSWLKRLKCRYHQFHCFWFICRQGKHCWIQ